MSEPDSDQTDRGGGGSRPRFDVSRYLRTDLRADAIAGLSVAVMGVPQAMAYATIAGLPPVFGLYTAIVTCTVAALLGSSNHLVTGPTNAACMVILSLTTGLPERYGLDLIDIVLLLTVLNGLIQLGFGLLKLGGIVRYVSNSVVIGFTAGAGILIAANQLKNMFGFQIPKDARMFHEVISATAGNLSETRWTALVLGVTTAVIVLALPKVSRRLPAALIGVFATGLLSYLLGWHDSAMGASRVEIIKDGAPIKGDLNIFSLPVAVMNPNWALVQDLLAGAFALAIIGSIEACSIARAVAAQSGQRLNFTREFIGQGSGKIVGAFFSCFSGSGSFTRTAVCYKSGGRTRMAAIFSAIWTLMTLLLFAPFANYIPNASLAGLLIAIAYSMVDKSRLKRTWRTGRNPRLVLFGTLVATLVLPLQFAIFVGVGLSLIILLRETGSLDITQLVPRSGGGFDEVPFNRAPRSPVITVNLEGDLYFAAVDDLDYELLRCLTPQTRVVVLRMKRLRTVGSTAMAVLAHYWEILNEQGIALVVCGIEEELKRVMTGSGLRRQIGEQNIFYADNKILQSTELAHARAWSIVRNQGQVATEITEQAAQGIKARDLMSRKCIRFGNQHQLREAVWLMSEMQREDKSGRSNPLFLQDRDGKLAGKLSPWRILRAFSENIDEEPETDRQLGERFREQFTRSIAALAETDFTRLERTSGLAALVECHARDGVDVIPICDDEGRIMGLVTASEALRALGNALQKAEADDE